MNTLQFATLALAKWMQNFSLRLFLTIFVHVAMNFPTERLLFRFAQSAMMKFKKIVTQIRSGGHGISMRTPRRLSVSGMFKMRIGQPQPQHNKPVKGDHNHNNNLTKSHTPTTKSTQFFYNKTPQPQPNFFKEKHHNTTTTQFFFKNYANLWFYIIFPQNWGFY